MLLGDLQHSKQILSASLHSNMLSLSTVGLLLCFCLNVSLQARTQKPIIWNSLKSLGIFRNATLSYLPLREEEEDVIMTEAQEKV